MKIHSIALVSLTLSLAAMANPTTEIVSQKCRLKAGKGPYSSFQVNYEIVNGEPTAHATLDIVYKNRSFAGSDLKRTLSTHESDGGDGLYARIYGYSGAFVTLKVTDSDFSSSEIMLGEGDDGVSAFVAFSSDGPAVRGFYICEKYPQAVGDYMYLGNNPSLEAPAPHENP